MRTTIIACMLAVALLGAVPLASAVDPEETVEERIQHLEECQEEFQMPPPSEVHTICGKLAQAYYGLTPWEATADAEICVEDDRVEDVEICTTALIDEAYVEECQREFTYPAPDDPDTVCGQIAKIYGDATGPTVIVSPDREVCLSSAATSGTCVPVSTCLGDYTESDVQACIV